MPTHRLIHMFHPGNALGAMCSVERLSQQAGASDGPAPTVLLHFPFVPLSQLETMADIIAALTASKGWARPRILQADEMNAILGAQGAESPQAAERLREWLGGPPPQEIHYVHTVVAKAAELSMRAYPQARRVSFGDALGILHNDGYHLAQYAGLSLAEREAAGRAHARLTASGALPQAGTVACLLPSDQKGDFVPGKELLVVPRDMARAIIDGSAEELAELQSYSQALLERLPAPRFLFLTENIVEASYSTFENAVALQEEMIRRHAPPGSSIIIKAHPLSTLDVHGELARRLAGDYSAEVLDEVAGRYPVEFMKSLVEACQPLCWSYGTLSLSYLYGKTPLHVIDDGLIRRYMDPARWESMRNSMRLILEPLDNLRTWDGASPLWSGTYETPETGQQ